jgi:hypothetical protein
LLPPTQVPIYVASLGPRDLELTGELADGWIGNALMPEQADVFLEFLDDCRQARPAMSSAATTAVRLEREPPARGREIRVADRPGELPPRRGTGRRVPGCRVVEPLRALELRAELRRDLDIADQRPDHGRPCVDDQLRLGGRAIGVPQLGCFGGVCLARIS